MKKRPMSFPSRYHVRWHRAAYAARATDGTFAAGRDEKSELYNGGNTTLAQHNLRNWGVT